MKKKTILASVLQLLQMLVGLISVFYVSPILLDSLGESTYGVWVLIITVAGYLGLLDLGLSFGAARRFAQLTGKGDEDQLARQYFYCRTCFRVISAIVAVAFAVFYFWTPDWQSEAIPREELRQVIFLVGVISTAGLLLRPAVAILKSHMNYTVLVAAAIVRLILFSVGVGIFLPTQSTLLMLALIWAVSSGVEHLITWWGSRQIYRNLPDSQCGKQIDKRELWHSGLKFFLGTIGQALRQKIDTPILAVHVSTSAVAQYSIGQRLPMLLVDGVNAIFGGNLMVAFTQASCQEGGEQKLQAALMSTLRYSVLISLYGGLGILLLGPDFITVWLGDGFEQSHLVLYWIVPPLTLSLMQYPSGAYLGALNRNGLAAVFGLIGAVFNAVASIILAGYYGFIGVLIGTTAEAFILTVIIRPILICRVGEMSLLTYFKGFLDPICRLLPAGSVSVAASLLLPMESYLQIALVASIISVSFLINGWGLIVSAAEKAQIIEGVAQILSPK